MIVLLSACGAFWSAAVAVVYTHTHTLIYKKKDDDDDDDQDEDEAESRKVLGFIWPRAAAAAAAAAPTYKFTGQSGYFLAWFIHLCSPLTAAAATEQSCR